MNLNQVTVAAHDMPKSVAFYKTLGLTLIVDTPDYARFECPDGESTFSLHRVDQKPPINDTIIYFECAGLDREYQRLLDAGIDFIQAPTDQSWLWREARLYDPSENQICLFWGGENRKNPPWRVN